VAAGAGVSAALSPPEEQAAMPSVVRSSNAPASNPADRRPNPCAERVGSIAEGVNNVCKLFKICSFG
jgi:hypothetical protein